MSERAIDELSKELNRLNWAGDAVRAREVARQLEQVLGEPTPENLEENVYSWILIAEARGDVAEAIRLQEPETARVRSELEAGGYESYPNALRKDVEYLQDALHLQAERHLKLGDRERARACVSEIHRLAESYGIRPDEDVQELFESLNR